MAMRAEHVHATTRSAGSVRSLRRMAELLDQPTPVRAGQGFDVAALAAWLRPRVEGLEGEPELLQFGRGYSNLTYLVRFGDARARRAPRAAGREHQERARHGARVPHPLGARAVVAEGAAAARALRRRVGHRHAVLRDGARARASSCARRRPRASCSTRRRCARVARRRATRSPRSTTSTGRAVGLGDLGKPAGVRRAAGARLGGALREGAHRRRAAGRAASAPGSRSTARPRAARRSSTTTSSTTTSCSRRTCARVVAVLDWEMATIGDPLMDLGTALGYWIEPDDPPVFQVTVFGPTNRAGQPHARASSPSAGRARRGGTRRTSSSTTRSPSSSSPWSRSSSTSAGSTGTRRKSATR